MRSKKDNDTETMGDLDDRHDLASKPRGERRLVAHDKTPCLFHRLSHEQDKQSQQVD